MKFDLTLSAVSENERFQIIQNKASFDLSVFDEMVGQIADFMNLHIGCPVHISHLEMKLFGLGGEDTTKIEVPKLFWNGSLTLMEFMSLLNEFRMCLTSMSGEDLHLEIAKYIAALTQAETVPEAIRNVDKIVLDIVHQPNMSRFQAKSYFAKKAMEKIIEEAKEKQLPDFALDALKTSVDTERFEKRYLESLVEFEWLVDTDYFYITPRIAN